MTPATDQLLTDAKAMFEPVLRFAFGTWNYPPGVTERDICGEPMPKCERCGEPFSPDLDEEVCRDCREEMNTEVRHER